MIPLIIFFCAMGMFCVGFVAFMRDEYHSCVTDYAIYIMFCSVCMALGSITWIIIKAWPCLVR